MRQMNLINVRKIPFAMMVNLDTVAKQLLAGNAKTSKEKLPIFAQWMAQGAAAVQIVNLPNIVIQSM